MDAILLCFSARSPAVLHQSEPTALSPTSEEKQVLSDKCHLTAAGRCHAFPPLHPYFSVSPVTLEEGSLLPSQGNPSAGTRNTAPLCSAEPYRVLLPQDLSPASPGVLSISTKMCSSLVT